MRWRWAFFSFLWGRGGPFFYDIEVGLFLWD
uniref:Uncharacterized protein n=1 Tax=Arundo donax TaxID=35708 RepID=A0A0A9HLB5_ARUDO